MIPIENIAETSPSLTHEMREEILAAAHAAARWEVNLRPANAGQFPHRIAATRTAILLLEHQLAELPSSASESPLCAD